ncbi:cytochrome P450 [Actinopolyspora erythraea]|uniref:Cytochrome P450 n=1 Tax=Actinopolyspora erythraea TaxID=414996 RepID=A0A099D8S2_9ACTN|nr:cytochrome P450 [Actinopolyspora erythraea]ASU78237.1 cytochrome P450 [Actinopolyspora erythraea]KGI81810.1 cytochrome P450 [Actinopolyspora erythraea]
MSSSQQCPHDSVSVLDGEFLQDPHVHYARMRESDPTRRVLTVTGMPVWLVTRYADARAALTDPRLSKDYRGMGRIMEREVERGAQRAEVSESIQAHMLNMDPPDHTRLRKLVVKAFTARRIEALRPRIEQITGELLDELAGTERVGEAGVDLLDEFAFPLPIRVICELLGVPEDRRDDFRRWSNTLVSGQDPEAAERAALAMGEYLFELVEDKRRDPRDDLLTALIETSDDSDRLSGEELIGMVFLLLVAGHETTVNLIGNGVLALLRDPEQYRRLLAEPERASSVVEETLRFDGPVNLATFRYTTEPVLVGDVEIPEDELVLVALGSANRDPERFAEPDRFDQDRATGGHLAFGHGIHFCVGAPLARLEGEIALRRLVERFPDLKLAVPDEQLRYRPSTLMRGLEQLPVRLS